MAAKDSVVIKSSAHGLTLVLNRDIAFEQLVRDICKKFAIFPVKGQTSKTLNFHKTIQ